MSQEGCDLQKTLEKALQKMPTLGKYVAMRIKKTLSIVYLLLIALMALGTIVGKYTSVEMAADQCCFIYRLLSSYWERCSPI